MLRRVAPMLGVVAALVPCEASALGAFLKGGGEAAICDRSAVVLVREGARAVLTVRARLEPVTGRVVWVLPVPPTLKRAGVKVVEGAAVDRVEQVAMPRVEELIEEDPCALPSKHGEPVIELGERSGEPSAREADVELVALKGAQTIDGLLAKQGVVVPPGSEKLLRSYAKRGQSYLVARVDTTGLSREGERVLMPTLQLSFDVDEVVLPVRVGQISSPGRGELLLHVLAKGRRYEAGNYPNIALPGEVPVGEAALSAPDAFYDALVDHAVDLLPKQMIIEHAAELGSCDGCAPSLSADELASLGARGSGYTLTRLRGRFARGTSGEDMEMLETPPANGDGARAPLRPRFVVKRRVRGARCENPTYGLYRLSRSLPVGKARGGAGVDVTDVVMGEVPALALSGRAPEPSPPGGAEPVAKKAELPDDLAAATRRAAGGCSLGERAGGAPWGVLVGLCLVRAARLLSTRRRSWRES